MRGDGTRRPRTGVKSNNKKQYHPKTKTGCTTCRIRRVKCDEAKPDCRRCSSTGRKCDGYFDCLQPRTPPSLQTALSSDPCSTTLERRMFEMFRYQTVPILSGHFPDETYDRTTLQLYYVEPAVRYAVNAFGAFHQELHATRLGRYAGLKPTLRMRLPAEQYSRALQEVQALLCLEDVPISVVLVCSLLLVQYEALQQSFLPAMVHAEKALGLLKLGKEQMVEESLLRTIMRFDAQSARHVGRKAPKLTWHAPTSDQRLPPALTSAVEARFLVQAWASRLYAFMQGTADQYVLNPGNVALEHISEAQGLEDVFARLDRLLLAFQREQRYRLSVRERHGLMVMRTRAKVLRIFAATCLYSEATMFDAYLDDFQEILHVCTALMNDDRADRRLFVLHVDEGLMHPLYVVATYCRDSSTRHQAFDLLCELPLGNGFRIWHADVVIRTARLIVEFEEAGDKGLMCVHVPEWRRVHNASFDNWETSSWHSSVGGSLRLRPNGMDGEWMNLRDIVGE